MSRSPISGVRAPEPDGDDQSVQRAWDRYAMPDLSSASETRSSPLALPARSSTNATLEIQVYDSSPSFGSTTALSDAFAKAESADLAEEDPELPIPPAA